MENIKRSLLSTIMIIFFVTTLIGAILTSCVGHRSSANYEGTLRLSVQSPAEVYLDKELVGEAMPGSVFERSVSWGDRRLEVLYRDGKRERQRVFIPALGEVEVVLQYLSRDMVEELNAQGKPFSIVNIPDGFNEVGVMLFDADYFSSDFDPQSMEQDTIIALGVDPERKGDGGYYVVGDDRSIRGHISSTPDWEQLEPWQPEEGKSYALILASEELLFVSNQSDIESGNIIPLAVLGAGDNWYAINAGDAIAIPHDVAD